MFNSANCLGYGQLDIAYAFVRDEGTETEFEMGVHPATYGTEYYGLHRGNLPPISDDIPVDDLYGGVEDRLIAAIDGAGNTDAVLMTLDDDADEVERLSRREELILRQHELNMIARGDAFAAKKGLQPSRDLSGPTVVHISITAVEEAESSPRGIGVRKDRDMNGSSVAKERVAPRSWKNQTKAPSQPKQFIRLDASTRR